jgi:hypothetical protein
MISNEPQRIYAAIFGGAVPPIVAERYLAAAAILEQHAAPQEIAGCDRAVAGGFDLEALELAARYTKRLPLLTRKMQLMAYLAETVPVNQDLFINRRASWLLGFLAAAGATLRTVAKMVTGLAAVGKVTGR